jgi:hypothetical protein
VPRVRLTRGPGHELRGPAGLCAVTTGPAVRPHPQRPGAGGDRRWSSWRSGPGQHCARPRTRPGAVPIRRWRSLPPRRPRPRRGPGRRGCSPRRA